MHGWLLCLTLGLLLYSPAPAFGYSLKGSIAAAKPLTGAEDQAVALPEARRGRALSQSSRSGPHSRYKKRLTRDEDKCPAWIAQYARWHAVARQRQDSRFLVWTCRLQPGKGDAYDMTNDCNGMGVRARGIMWALRVAAASQRVLLVLQTLPAPMEHFLKPGEINWLADLAMHNTALSMASENAGLVHHARIDSEADPAFADIQKGALSAVGAWSQYRIVTLDTGMLPSSDAGPGAPAISKGIGHDWHCMFNALFLPSLPVEQKRIMMLRSATVMPPYIAAHVRLGLTGEDLDTSRYPDKEEALQAAAWCMQHMVENKAWLPAPGSPRAGPVHEHVHEDGHDDGDDDAHNVTLPLVLLTDNMEARRGVLAGKYGRNVYSPRNEPVHFQKGPAGNATAAALLATHVETLAEIYIMAKATCLVYCHSGFSQMALLWGWNLCRMELDQCIVLYRKKNPKLLR